jgi:hypothetical protein
LSQQAWPVSITNKQSEKEDDAPNRNLVANKTSADIKPNPTARAIASQMSWWESPEARVLYCVVKRREEKHRRYP